MRAARLVSIPIEHVTATFAAFPLASEAALGEGLTALDPDLAKHAGTRSLWRQTELATLGSFPGFSVDEAVSMRDKIWFADKTGGPTPLHVYVRRLANWFLDDCGPLARPKLPSAARGDQANGMSAGEWMNETPTASVEALARRGWKWLGLEMPPDLLLAALGDTAHGPAETEVVSPAIARHLADQGFAESHLHYGAGMDFASLWVSVQHAAATSAFRADSLQSPGAELDEGRRLAPWLVRALLARYVLAAFLAWGRGRGDLSAFLAGPVLERLNAARFPGAFSMLLACLSDLRRGQLSTTYPFRHWQALYSHVTGISTYKFPSEPEQVASVDPVARLLWRHGAGRATPEMQFVAEGLADLDSNRRDPLFEQLFWQVIRVRGLFFRHVVQRPLTPGLSWFIRFYGRLSAPKKPMGQALQMRTAARVCGVGRGLRALEIRTAPDKDISWLLKLAQEATRLQTELARHDCEVGLVFHFCKDRGGGFVSGVPQGGGQDFDSDPQSKLNRFRFRFANFHRARWRETQAVAWLLENFPACLRVVRGVDVCTDELGVPNWALAPHLAHVHRVAGRLAARQTAAHHHGAAALSPLRTTVHAGEDFVHLLTGLRLVDEAMDCFGLRDGDRIGHGMALGIDARDWARRAGRLAMAREDRLFDLVWEWTWHERLGSDSARGRKRLDLEIMRLAERIFGVPLPPFELTMLRRDLHDFERLEAVGFPDRPLAGTRTWGRTGRLSAYLTDAALYRRGREILFLDPAEDGEWLAQLQGDLRRKVGARGITVEVNPTSNLLIGDLEDLTAHPLWRLRPPRPTPHDAPPVSVCIGSDDPVVFNTDLRQEYQCLSDALKLAGLSEEEAFQWLDRTRRAGLDTRFTLQAK